MLRTLRYNLGMGFGLLKLCFLAPSSGFEKLEKEGKFQEYNDLAGGLIRGWAQRRIKQSGARIKVKGIENIPLDRTVLFVANHQSNFDIPAILGTLPTNKGFVAKKELGEVPVLGYWMRRIRCQFMDRSDIKQSMQVILDTIELLKKGYNMVIFPEGTRSKGKPVREFKAGSFKPAIKAKVPIIPITMDGTYRIIEGNPKNHVRPADVNITVHPLIETKDLTKEEIKELPQKVQKIITDCMVYTPKSETEVKEND